MASNHKNNWGTFSIQSAWIGLVVAAFLTATVMIACDSEPVSTTSATEEVDRDQNPRPVAKGDVDTLGDTLVAD